ncbi:MAG: hypothetical protein KatS3mg077_0691 [Candidatus Binatia bacterium]|nr:MAG: hypothetical protein KatS3mg077_0691 [Candidatus Binatia bacterium]
MDRVLVVVDNNVNARVVCEVLLEARGDSCILCSRGELHERCVPLEPGKVVLFELNLQNHAERRALQALLDQFRSEMQTQLGLLVVTEQSQILEQTGLSDAVDFVLHPTQVGARLLATLDYLRARRTAAQSIGS